MKEGDGGAGGVAGDPAVELHLKHKSRNSQGRQRVSISTQSSQTLPGVRSHRWKLIQPVSDRCWSRRPRVCVCAEQFWVSCCFSTKTIKVPKIFTIYLFVSSWSCKCRSFKLKPQNVAVILPFFYCSQTLSHFTKLQNLITHKVAERRGNRLEDNRLNQEAGSTAGSGRRQRCPPPVAN